VRAAMKSAKIESVDLTPPERLIRLEIERTYKPEAAGRAQMFEGAPEEIADKLVEVLTQNSVI
jgi:electron transfer flavoprotein alpha/beta subunit